MVAQQFCKLRVVGSNPITGSINKASNQASSLVFFILKGILMAISKIELKEMLELDKDKIVKQSIHGDKKRFSVLLKLFAIISIITSAGSIFFITLVSITFFNDPESFGSITASGVKLWFLISDDIVATARAVGFLLLGISLLQNRQKRSAHLCEFTAIFVVLSLLSEILLQGFGLNVIGDVLTVVLLISISLYVDPSLSEERQLKRKLRIMEDRSDSERGDMDGRDLSGKGFIRLDFFNVFWIFVVCCIIGIIVETVFCYFANGVIENRTGMLWGMFSPIYGFGAVLMTLALNRFYKANFLIIFLVSAVIGGAFEYLTSYYMEYAFGIVAWDYSGTFLSIDGRTNGFFMCAWGLLGTLWVKLLLPRMLVLIKKIPWNWRYGVTIAAAVFMLVNGIMTTVALDCWKGRVAGEPQNLPYEQFFETHYGNEFMENHFQTMSIDPSKAKEY